MYKLYPYFTNDGSVGLFSPEADDIYHSTYGALSEAYEKFIIPAELEKYFENNSEIKVLDICYGIGYNTKSFLNFIFENILQKNKKNILEKTNSTDTIYTNNNPNKSCNEKIYSDNATNINSDLIKKENNNLQQVNNETIYSNNKNGKISVQNTKNYKIFVNAIDIDPMLCFLSPFFRQGNKSDLKHNKINFNYEKINKLLSSNFQKKYNLKNEINFLLLNKIIEKYPEIFENQDLSNILKSKEYRQFFDPKIKGYFEFLKKSRGKYTPHSGFLSFLHNIYYKYVSTCYKTVLKSLILNDFNFEPKIGDARLLIKEDKNKYNFIFLDAFTPTKCPMLWSVEFFKLLFEHLEENGMILTYTNSAAVRNAMLNAGFYVGKIYNDEFNKFTGTIATKNKSLIKTQLSEYDIGLINSKAGIFYRDENLTGLNEAIILNRENEVKNSDKISSSRFIKDYKRKNDGKL